MAQEAGKDPRGDSEGHDTDERFEDHPEQAPSESRIGVERVKSLEQESIRRRANTGDIVEDAGDRHRKIELDFGRNHDFGSDEMRDAGGEDFTRGSGFLGGKLVGEGPSGEPEGIRSSAGGFDPSREQERNIEAIRREEEPVQDWSAHIPDSGSEATQGREVLRTPQTTGSHGFGRDIGSTGLIPEEREGRGFSTGKALNSEHKLWAHALSRLGGSSPGSEENLQLAQKFAKVQFPADKEAATSKLEPGAEFRIREGISVDLKEAVEKARLKVFRNLGDLVDAVKDELRRQEAAGRKLLKSA